jgi:hypothetical protein
VTETTAPVDVARSPRRGASEYVRSALLWLLLAATVEIAWVFAELDANNHRLLPLPYNLALLLLAGVAPALAKHRYFVWFAAAMPLWILLLVVIGAWRS